MSVITLALPLITGNVGNVYNFTIPSSASKTFTITDIHLSSFAYYAVSISLSGTWAYGGNGGDFEAAVGPGNQVNLASLKNGPSSVFGGSNGVITVTMGAADYFGVPSTYTGLSNYPGLRIWLAGELV
jgi:hypothetical protein